MATAPAHTIPEYFNASLDDPNCFDEVVISSSIILTPENTPTKSLQNGQCSPPQDDQESYRVSNKALLSRSHSDSHLESPKPTQCKQTRSDIHSKCVEEAEITSTKPPLGCGKTRTCRSRRPAKSRATEPKKPAETVKSSKKSTKSKKSTRSRSVPATRNENYTDTYVTDYFPIRRSGRMTSSDVKKQQQTDLEEKILSGCEDGLEVVELLGKGRGVVSTKSFQRGDFVVEYIGSLVDSAEAKRRELLYTDNPEFGCYMYHFNFQNKRYCVDATKESNYLGRLLNHSKLNGNCCTKVVGIGSKPYLVLVAMRDIKIGEELLYDYGDRSKEAIEAHPWLAL